MPKPLATRVFPLAGYELRAFEEALGLRLTYTKGNPVANAPEAKTPMMIVMPDEARELARDLLELADKVEAAAKPPPDTPLH